VEVTESISFVFNSVVLVKYNLRCRFQNQELFSRVYIFSGVQAMLCLVLPFLNSKHKSSSSFAFIIYRNALNVVSFFKIVRELLLLLNDSVALRSLMRNLGLNLRLKFKSEHLVVSLPLCIKKIIKKIIWESHFYLHFCYAAR
jgi:hypothetical protein